MFVIYDHESIQLILASVEVGKVGTGNVVRLWDIRGGIEAMRRAPMLERHDVINTFCGKVEVQL